MKKKFGIPMALSLALLASGSAFAAPNYNDVNGNWAQSNINQMVDMQVMSGFNDNNFYPDAWVTRAEFSQMTAKTLGLDPQKADSVPSLKKLDKNDLGMKNVDNQSWISSYPSGVFRPANPVRRVEALAAVGGTINKPQLSDDETKHILSRFSDADQIPSEARKSVAQAVKYNILPNDPATNSNMLEPTRPITRAESASLLSDLYQNRDIAIVQNGQVVASADQQNSMTSSGSSAVSGGNTSSSGAANTSTETTTTTNNAANTNPAVVPENEKIGYKSNPYHNSADTIPEFRMVNTTPTPTNLDANAPVSLPPNTTFTGTVAKALYSEYNKPGDPVMLILDHPLMDANGKVIAPAGSRILGVVTNVVSRNMTNDNAQLGINFNGLITPAGQRIPINASIANADGVLKANELEGVVFHPEHSVAALGREISTAEGSLYGTKVGKAAVLDEPLVQQLSSRPIDPMDKSPSNIVIGVGDRLQLRMESVGVNNTFGTNTNTQ